MKIRECDLTKIRECTLCTFECDLNDADNKQSYLNDSDNKQSSLHVFSCNIRAKAK